MKSHRTDVVSLVFGLVFVLIAGWWAAAHYFDLEWRYDWDVPNLGWIVAGGLILLGLLGILSTLRTDRTATDAVGPGPATPGEAAPGDAAPATGEPGDSDPGESRVDQTA